ncbi:MAG: 2-ketoisovalerate ferredoxin oxidoreductase [Deltaproteobacteria bacterium]|nr:MAG: 2-ketoisovalerate ferredoxin oxidoreductase [Deltaproteobacteria bacterium]
MSVMSECPTRQILNPGNSNCGGCGATSGLSLLSRAVGERNIQIVIPACCSAVAAGLFPNSVYGVPALMTTFAATASGATGLSVVAKLNGEDTRVVCWAGDGGTYDIGMATLSAAAERNEDILYICYDNEIYGNTGGQRSSATPHGATTTNTPPGGKVEVKKDIMEIMAAHRVPYAATVSIAHQEDAIRKMRYALDARGFRFLHLLSPCPTGWKSEPSLGLELVRLAVRSGLFPLMEIFEGKRRVVNVEPDFSQEALARYLNLQRRFKKSGIEPETLASEIEEHWSALRAKIRCFK